MDLIPSQNLYYSKLKSLLKHAQTDEELFSAIVNTPFLNKRKAVYLGLGVVVLLKVNTEDTLVERIALSNTDSAKGAIRMSSKPFNEIAIPIGHTENIIVMAITQQKEQITTDWKHLFEPALSPQEARFNQAGAGIACSVVLPLTDAGCQGAMIYSYFVPQENITDKHYEFMRRYTAIASQKLKLTFA